MRISFLNFWDSWGIATETLISYPHPVADAATDAPTDEETDELIRDSESEEFDDLEDSE